MTQRDKCLNRHGKCVKNSVNMWLYHNGKKNSVTLLSLPFCVYISFSLLFYSHFLSFSLSSSFLCFPLFLLLRPCSGLYVTLVAKVNTKTVLMQKGSSNKGDEMSGTCSMHRKMRSGYKDLVEKLQENIFLVETYEYEEGKSKAVHEGVRGTEAWLHSFLTSAYR